MYAINAQLEYETHEPGSITPLWHGSRQIPTFFLHENVQGIMSEEHATTVARDILDPLGQHNDRLHITAVKVS